MSAPRFKFHKLGGPPFPMYEVWLMKLTGPQAAINLGTVEKWERRYNLRRVYVSRGWRARAADGTKLYHQESVTDRTRDGAALALLQHRNQTEGPG